ncbi:MAG: tRNA N6-adenosine threonylcarbamoyltransferase [Candidatus Micrarchaeota archaeon]|nr:MAG: tRNA N6-adenosine threonylcarbamoyltransferase [Candidatus Micrarchaeota archaeon]
MYTLGIESTAHTFGVGIVRDGEILANVKEMYKIDNKGMIPIKVAEHHLEVGSLVIKKALEAAGVGIKDIDNIAYSKGPGLGPCLRVGFVYARALSLKHNIDIIPVHHGIAHIEIVKSINKVKDPLAVYLSGGNSQILALEGEVVKRYKIYGETLDIGIGNLFDSFAREAGLNPAWGSTVAAIASKGKNYIGMPYTVKGMDFTFSGLLTYSTKLVKSKRYALEDIAFSLMETAFDMILESAERALFISNKKAIVVAGGVAQNTTLIDKLKTLAEDDGVKLYFAEPEYNADNGAMIAVLGEKYAKSGVRFKDADISINQKYRIDKVDIYWS